jgi:hypothetical protein
MNEIVRSIILISLVMALGSFFIFFSAFLLRFLYKPWVILILSLIGLTIIRLVVNHLNRGSLPTVRQKHAERVVNQ